MRGNAARQVEMLTAVTPDALIPQGHPMRRIKPMVARALAQLPPPLPGCTPKTGAPRYRRSTC